MKMNKKTLTLILVLALAIPLSVSLNVRKAHAVTTLTLTSPANNTQLMDQTPDFVFLPVSTVSLTLINCTVYVGDVASGDVSASNNTETTITCNHTLTVSGYPYEWYINATDADGTYKSEVRNIYVVPSTGPIDIPDYVIPSEPDPQPSPRIPVKEIAGLIVLCVAVAFLVVGKRR